MSIADNIKAVRQRIARSCEKAGRPADSVTLVCVTKGAGLDRIEEALGLGVKVVGENRVQEALQKYGLIGSRAEWHMVGHLQTNKAKDAAKIFSLIHSVDSMHLVKEIDKEAARIGKVQDMLIQVNTSAEKSKFGMAPDEVADFLKGTLLYRNISIKGLMTIAPEVNDPEEVRPYFRRLRELRDEAGSQLKALSMGMSNDFEVAIEEGATIVRIGRAIFGK